MTRHLRILFLSSVVLMLGATAAQAQWRTETFALKPGWQAIHLRVDTEDAAIETLLADYPQIEEVWRWMPEALDQRIVDEPGSPATGVEWQIWKRNDRANTNLSTLYANSAYLVKVAAGASPFTASIKGLVTSPTIHWRTDGLNLVGFPTNPSSPPTIERYLAPAEVLDQLTEIYEYTGGPLQSGVNPARVTARQATLKRGQAYWMRTTKYADYDGPLRVRAAIGEGVDFGSGRPTVRIVLRNRTDRSMDATLTPTASEPPPGSSTAPQAVPLTRLESSSSGSGSFKSFDKPFTVRLRPNETIGMTLGIDRSRLTGNPGDKAFSLVKVTDGERLSEFYVPARAEVASLAGLWVGEAEITRVQNQLQRFQKDEAGNHLVDESGHYIPEYKKDNDGNVLTDADGQPIPDADTELNPVAQVFRLKLILHVDDSGVARLLSRVYVGIVGADAMGLPVVGVATGQDALRADRLNSASRISAVHLPKKTNLPLSGAFGPGGQLSGTLVVAHGDPANPFIHTYHPDHDNLDARFESPLPEGYESYRIERDIVLTLDASAGIVTDPSWGTTLLTGVYAESLEGLHKESIATQGVFAIRRLMSESQLIESD